MTEREQALFDRIHQEVQVILVKKPAWSTRDARAAVWTAMQAARAEWERLLPENSPKAKLERALNNSRRKKLTKDLDYLRG